MYTSRSHCTVFTVELCVVRCRYGAIVCLCGAGKREEIRRQVRRMSRQRGLPTAVQQTVHERSKCSQCDYCR